MSLLSTNHINVIFDKIKTLVFGTNNIADKAITEDKLADEVVAKLSGGGNTNNHVINIYVSEIVQSEFIEMVQIDGNNIDSSFWASKIIETFNDYNNSIFNIILNHYSGITMYCNSISIVDGNPEFIFYKIEDINSITMYKFIIYTDNINFSKQSIDLSHFVKY